MIGSAAVVAVLAGLAVSAAGEGTPTRPRTTTGSSTATAAVAETVLENQDVQGILGRQVVSSAGENMGRVVDVVVDRAGQARAAVIDFGGFLGVGNRKVAVDWNALHFAPTGSRSDRITLGLTREQVNTAPDYREDKPLVMLGAADGLPD